MLPSLFLFNERKIRRTGLIICLAERMGFEPMRDLHLLAVFETAPFNRLGTSPAVVIIPLTVSFLIEKAQLH